MCLIISCLCIPGYVNHNTIAATKLVAVAIGIAKLLRLYTCTSTKLETEIGIDKVEIDIGISINFLVVVHLIGYKLMRHDWSTSNHVECISTPTPTFTFSFSCVIFLLPLPSPP